jgi:hypothetical protein
MKKIDRFSYKGNQWGGDKKQYKTLERTGPENVRVRLAQTDAGSRGAVSIGAETITIGFAQEWLAWHDRRKIERETDFRSHQIFWTRFAALSAGVAGLAGAVGWAYTIFKH